MRATTNHAGQDMSPSARAHRAATAERVIARLAADPEWVAEQADGGADAFDFIRNAADRNNRTQAERDASLRANVERCLAAMREGR